MFNLEVIEPIINYRKVKYSKMDEMINMAGLRGDKLNMFINLDTVLNKFYDPNVFSAFKSLKGKELIQLTSEIFNLIAHYRNYFWTRYKVPTTFYIYHLNKEVKNCKKIDSDYLSTALEKKHEDHVLYGIVNYVFNKNMDLIKTISKYIKNTYYIDSNGLDPSVIPYYLIDKLSKSPDTCNIIMTSDKVDYNLTNFDNTYILKAGGKHSELIHRDNIFDYKFKNIKYRPNIELSPELYSLISAMIGSKSRNIKTVCGFTKACKIIEKGINEYYIRNRYNVDIESFANNYFNKVEAERIINNYKCLDVRRHFRNIKEVDEIRIFDNIVDRFDNEAIMQLNSNYFETNNIQLIELCRGVD